MSENLARPQFSKALSGYKPEEVDPYINQLLSVIDSLKEENEIQEEKIAVLAESVQKYRDDEDSLREALLGAQKMSDSILKNANNKAELTMREASVKASHIVQEAHQKVEDEKNELIRVQQEVSAFKTALIDMYREHIELIAKIPSAEKAEEPKREEMADASEEELLPAAAAAEEEHDEASVDLISHPVEQAAQPESEPLPEEAPAAEETEEKEPEQETEPAAAVSSFPAAGEDIFAEFEKKKSEILNFDISDRGGRRSKFSDLKFGDQFNLMDDDDF